MTDAPEQHHHRRGQEMIRKPKIKPMVWEPFDPESYSFFAGAFGGEYICKLSCDGGMFAMWPPYADIERDDPKSCHDSLADAVAAAQADYEARILSALDLEETDDNLAAALAEAREALQVSVDHEVDYMKTNKLGNPDRQHRVVYARAAVARIDAILGKKAGGE